MTPPKERGYTPPVNEDEKLLQRRVADAVKQVSATGKIRLLGFFNDREKHLATASLNRLKWVGFAFFGGVQGAEREMLCVFEDADAFEGALGSDFSIVCVRIDTFGDASFLSHRDYLGAILGCGIQRDCVGDIQADDKGAVVWIKAPMVGFLQEQLQQVGRLNVTLAVRCTEEPEMEHKPKVDCVKASVASLRLDAVLAAMLHESRGRAAALVQQRRVQINHVEITSIHHNIYQDDVFSVRGEGKFRLTGVGGKSRKGRIWIEFLKY